MSCVMKEVRGERPDWYSSLQHMTCQMIKTKEQQQKTTLGSAPVSQDWGSEATDSLQTAMRL